MGLSLKTAPFPQTVRNGRVSKPSCKLHHEKVQQKLCDHEKLDQKYIDIHVVVFVYPYQCLHIDLYELRLRWMAISS